MGRRRALLIACSEYSDPKLLSLAGALADVRTLSVVLSNREISDFEVEILENPSSYELSHALERFYMETKLHDVALVYCSCHGVKSVDGRLFLAATNSDTNYLASTAVPASFLQDQILACRSKQKVLVLDCCYAGAFLRGSRHRAAATVPLSDAFSGGKGTVYIASSGATQYSWEGDHVEGSPQPSLFTQCLIEGLETGEADLDKDGLIGVRELFDYVVDKLPDRTPHQRPEFSAQEYVEIYLTRTPLLPTMEEPEVEVSDDPDAESVMPLAIESPLKEDVPEEKPFGPPSQFDFPDSQIDQSSETTATSIPSPPVVKLPDRRAPDLRWTLGALVGVVLIAAFFGLKALLPKPTNGGSTPIKGAPTKFESAPVFEDFSATFTKQAGADHAYLMNVRWNVRNANELLLEWPDGLTKVAPSGTHVIDILKFINGRGTVVSLAAAEYGFAEEVRKLQIYRVCSKGGQRAGSNCPYEDWEYAAAPPEAVGIKSYCAYHNSTGG
ncbi:MAG: caspase family protein [Chlorobia bacterium]|nr:caspase family protein [Fimbriimonadaceae bacterium]